ncbi:acyl-CoA N-acyltransferase [Paraphaeosphaeria sporulosa]|uniref:histone acetyltransferase n=1 Tax=Paraphaeosphaeria sporulosa TaxID=1460663 RepID=A0A177C965_9PLEO|nr:acyl-CoA N-acyltransferase [Paraphaeosphaeria sporulosa]OAG03661.1 acyl-CoA N-acyltransferase [Paraphaeosphaeria sporulosa]
MAVSAPLPNGTTPLGAKESANGDPNAAEKAAQPSARNVHNVVLGSLVIEPWFSSEGYPEEIVGKEVDKLYVCQWCFKYTKELVPFLQHMVPCPQKACPARTSPPPGTCIYTRDHISIHELDGASAKLYAQNLSLFAKLFLHAKSVFYDVSAFLFYLLVLDPAHPSIPNTLSSSPDTPAQVVGFFSKEKTSWDNNNLACICVFPPWQKQGLAQVLIAASYVLGRNDGRTGGPEKPLSAHGYAAYVHYWSQTLARSILQWSGKTLTVAELHEETGIAVDDVQNTLGAMGVLERRKKGWVVNRGRVRAWVEVVGGRVESPVDEEAFVVRDDEGTEEENEEDSEE